MKHQLARPNGTMIVFRMALALGLACGFQAQAGGTSGSWASSDPSNQLGPSMRAAAADVSGVWTGNEGRLTWRLDSTWGTAGFYVYRVDPETGAETRLNDLLLPVAFHVPDATYELADPEAVAGGAGMYRLEEVELAGAVFDLGVYEVTFEPPAPAAKTVRAPKASAPMRRDAPVGTSSVLRVTLKREGLYGVSLESIAAGMGLEVEDVEELAAEDSLRFRSQGRPVPLLYDAARGRVVFHGQPINNWYAPEASYLISIGVGRGMPRRAPGATNGQAVFRTKIRFEEDRWPFDGVVQRPEDFYYWNFIVSTTNPASNLVDFALGLDGYVGGELTLNVDLQGWSKSVAQNPDHHAEFSLNGTPVGSCAFNDQDAVTAELAIPAGVAVPGTNVLTVRGALPPGFSYSYFVLDGVTAEFNRPLVPGEATTHLQAEGAASISAQAFEEPLALALDGERWFPTWIADENGELPDKAWTAAASNECFAVIEADAVPMLVPEPAVADAWFMSETNRIDYLVFTSRALAPAAQELADYRAGQGLRVGLATYEDACDLFYDGLRTPQVIPELLSHAAAYWAESPQMMVLAGNGHYDYRGVLSNEVNHLPPLLLQTYDGLFAADELLAQAGGDDLPDVAFGRLPARSAEELAAMIAKIIAYEAAGGFAWQNQWVFANDAGDAAGDFAGSVARFTNLVQNPYSVSARINLDVTPIAPARAAFLGGFSNGAGLVHYTGHGLTAKLSSQGLLTAADVHAMTNARQPIAVALACLSGHFEAPAVDSVAELLMQQAEGGAVAVWASSAMSLNAPATDLGETFYRYVLQNGSNTLGGATLGARRALPGDIFTRNTYATYNLLGDPALRVPGYDSTNAWPAQVYLGNLAQTYDGTPKSATATTDPAGLTVEFTYDGLTNVPVAAGTYAVVATVVDSNFAGSVTGGLVVAKATAIVALGDLEHTYDGTPKSATATTDPAGLEVEFTYAGDPAPPTDAGEYAVAGTIADANYEGTATDVLEIQKGDQTIDFAVIGDPVAAASINLSATASSGLAVSFGVVSGPAVLSGSTLVFQGFGSVVVAARQAGDGNWNVAEEVTQAFQVVPVALSADQIRVRENGEGRFFVKLSQAPAAAETVTVARCAGSADLSVADGAALVFRPSNWSAWQAVTLAAAADTNGAAETGTFCISMPGAADRFVEATVLDGDVGENLASPARGTVISGTKGYFLPLAIDGVHTSSTQYAYTIWTNVPPGTMTLDLRGTTTVSRLRLLNWDWSVRSHRYAIESSENGQDWALLVDAGSGEHGGWEEWLVAAAPARYLRFTGLSNSAHSAVCIAEWEVYGPTNSDPWPVCSATEVNVREAGEGRLYVRLNRAPETNVAVNVELQGTGSGLSVAAGASLTFKPSNWNAWQAVTLVAEADSNAGDETASLRIFSPGTVDRFVTARALDDDIGSDLALASSGTTISGTKAYQLPAVIDGVHAVATNYGFLVWTNLQQPGTMTLDLQGTATVSRMRVLTYDWAFRSHRYRVESSLDGTNWTVQADASAGEHRGWEDWPVATAAVRYVRFTGLSNSANSAVCVAEWEVYGVRAPRPELELVSTNANVREAGEGRVFVRLDRAPVAAVTAAVAHCAGSAGLSVADGAALVFRPSNWSVWQAVTLAAEADENAVGETAMFRISVPGAQDRFVAATALDDDVGANLALASAGAQIAGTRAYQLPLAIDGQHLSSTNYAFTVWTNDPPGAMTLDLGTVQNLAQVRLLNWDWSPRFHRYRIDSSEDGTTWSLLVDASAGEHRGWEDWAAYGRSARYVRLTGLFSSANSAMCIAEWEVYAAPPPAKRAPAATAKLSGAEPFPLTVVTSDDGPEHTNGWAAVDGDPNTAWEGRAGAGGWHIAVGYDATRAMTNLVVDLAEGAATRMQCLHSLDGEDWLEWPEDAAADPVEANYLWLLFPGEDEESPAPRVIEITPQFP